MKKILLFITALSCMLPRQLLSLPRGHHMSQITPVTNMPNVRSMNEQETTSNRPYCTYECLEKSSPAQCIKATGNCAENCMCSSTNFCDEYICSYVCPSPRQCEKLFMALVAIIDAPFLCPAACIKDTVCLPCDRNENPPKCYPYSKMVCKATCYFATCEKCESLSED